jgi:hypothetical protein
MTYPIDNPLDGSGRPAGGEIDAGRAAMPAETTREPLRASRRALSAMEGLADGMRDAGMRHDALSAEIQMFRAAIAAAEAR